jgi:hypothetical protein
MRVYINTYDIHKGFEVLYNGGVAVKIAYVLVSVNMVQKTE